MITNSTGPLTVVRLTAEQHGRLRRQLFPGDGNESVALALIVFAALALGYV